ncbi:DUF2852 domain-containing protein [Aliiroseovarius subalbicans]|uniref:DUF2852 domain-containing protein n=1 Tax=Aliiroseovarius subalbicans TaxID=2925840 RepID=UPI001F58972A|nr:DUF2852 domain-containing protein [Aliiroseovarius subalbicans]MCI2398462.1 DUF2852 domain-containing protein [Aliiroseovarius subalbicans]
MSTAAQVEMTPQTPTGWFSRAEAWLDARGKGAWIATMVVGFILFWPVGLALLAYMIWSKRMFSKSCRHHAHHSDANARMSRRHGFRSSGNTAFDAYKAETLQRLMDEQDQFEAFLERLRAAKDKSEFDDFMEDRAKAAKAAPAKDGDAEDIVEA